MMATPQDLEDFAFGFSLTEGIVGVAGRDRAARDRRARRSASSCGCGSPKPRAEALNERRRHLAGPDRLRPCGIESLDRGDAAPPPVVAAPGASTPADIMQRARRARAAAGRSTGRRAPCMPPLLAARTRASSPCARMSAATMRSTSSPARWRAGRRCRAAGFVVLTSRVSVEMVQKAAAIGVPRHRRGLGADRAGGAHGAKPPASRSSRSRATTASRSSPIPQRIKGRAAMPPVMSPDKLVYMANQIGKFFASQGDDAAVAGIADTSGNSGTRACGRPSSPSRPRR